MAAAAHSLQTLMSVLLHTTMAPTAALNLEADLDTDASGAAASDTPVSVSECVDSNSLNLYSGANPKGGTLLGRSGALDMRAWVGWCNTNLDSKHPSILPICTGRAQNVCTNGEGQWCECTVQDPLTEIKTTWAGQYRLLDLLLSPTRISVCDLA